MFFRVTLMLAAMSAAFVGWAQQPVPIQTELLRDVRLIDGTGAAPRGHVSRLVRRRGRRGGATIFTAGRGIGVPEGAPGLPAAADQIYRPATVEEARKDVEECAAHRADMVKIWVDKL